MDAPVRNPQSVTPQCGYRPAGATATKPRSLRFEEWPISDQLAWMEACRPAQRLQRGGAASHLAPVSQADIARRYGLFLDFLQRHGLLNHSMGVVALVTPSNVDAFIAELQARVRSVTVWNSVYKLRRAAQLMAPSSDYSWLAEIEKDIALIMVPRSKASRLVLTERILEAGIALIQEAKMFGKTPMACAKGVRNGLIIALLALHPIRIKNFAALSIGDTFLSIDGRWWLRIPSSDTKSRQIDQRQVPEFMTEAVNNYIEMHRPILCRKNVEESALWLSSTTGRPLNAKILGSLISNTTRETIGVDVSPHLFRTADASTAAAHATKYPHLATALLNHRDPRITEEHYIRASSMSAAQSLADIINSYRHSS
jgi:integrase